MTMSRAIGPLDNVGIAVRDIDSAIRFYRDTLGFELNYMDAENRAASVRTGSIDLFLYQTLSADNPARTADYVHNPIGPDHLSFRVEDVDAAFATLVSAGAEVIMKPENADWGARVCGCRDPSGIPLYFLKWREQPSHA